MVRKHTIDIQPGTKRRFRARADALGRWAAGALGRWAFHCHLLYHMESGMFREVSVEEWGWRVSSACCASEPS